MELDTVVNADCIAWMNSQPEPFVDLVFADPPFNIGYQYDVYEDRKAYDEYHQWTEDWMAGCCHILKPTGSFWVAIGAEYAAEVRLIGRKLGLTLRNWVIWHYTFGQSTKAKFARAHAHLFYFVKDPKAFTFNDMVVRTFSDRQMIYHDKRANPDGKMPDDVWSEFPRVCGTFGEREGWHPCQMPVSILSRIIRSCSNVGDVVFDPFSGSGTTLAAAKRLDRHYMGTEMSANYVENIHKRLDNTPRIREAQGHWPKEHIEELQGLYMTAGVSLDMLEEWPFLADGLALQFHRLLESAGDTRRYETDDICQKLGELQRSNQLGIIKVHAVLPRLRRSAPGTRRAPAKTSKKAGRDVPQLPLRQ